MYYLQSFAEGLWLLVDDRFRREHDLYLGSRVVVSQLLPHTHNQATTDCLSVPTQQHSLMEVGRLWSMEHCFHGQEV